MLDGWSLARIARGAAHWAPRRGSSGWWRRVRTTDADPFSLGTLRGARRVAGFRKAVALVLVLVWCRCWASNHRPPRSSVGTVLACWEEAGMLRGIQPKL